MRRTKEQKQQTHRQILKAASRTFRSKGIEGAGISELMGEADLTHGGFYAHFENKEALIAEMCEFSLSETVERFLEGVEQLPEQERLAAFIRGYVSRQHRNQPEEGCLIPTLAEEVARQQPAVRDAFTRGVEQYVERFASYLTGVPEQECKEQMLVLLAGMAGTILVARALTDQDMSDRLLLNSRAFYTRAFAAMQGATSQEKEVTQQDRETEELARKAIKTFITPRRYDRPERERQLVEAGTPLQFAGQLQALSWGEGPTVLLVHGWEGRGTQLGAFVQPLVAAGRRVVAFDAPAHGDSPGKEMTMMDFVHALLVVGKELGPLEGIIAHSMGAGATALALRRGLDVQRVVLVASPSSMPKVIERFLSAYGVPVEQRPTVAQYFSAHIQVPVDELEVAALGTDFKTPALLLHDPTDREVPFSESEAIAAHWPAASLHPIEGRGHRRILWDAEVVRLAVAFITVQ